MLPAHPQMEPSGLGTGQPWEQLSLPTVSLHPGLSTSSHPCGFPPRADAQQPAGNAQEKRPRASWGCAVPGAGGARPTIGLQHTGAANLAQTPPPFPSLILAIPLCMQRASLMDDATLPVPSPCCWKLLQHSQKQLTTTQQLDIPGSSFCNHLDMHH